MDTRKYITVSGIIFAVVALLHLLRFVFQWDASIGGWSVPLWLSVVTFCVTGYLAVVAFRLGQRR